MKKTSFPSYLLIVALIIPVLFHFVWMFLSAFKTQLDIISWPPKFAFAPTLQNFQRVFGEQSYMKYLINSSIVAFSAVAFSLMIGLPAA